MSGKTTKMAIAYALKELVEEKSLNRITIQDIADKCGINRQTFYYHFPNIIDLVEWILYTDAEKLMQGNKTYHTWQKGYLSVFKTIEKDKSFILNVYHHAPREYIKSFLYTVTQHLLLDVVEEKTKLVLECVSDTSLKQEEKQALEQQLSKGYSVHEWKEDSFEIHITLE